MNRRERDLQASRVRGRVDHAVDDCEYICERLRIIRDAAQESYELNAGLTEDYGPEAEVYDRAADAVTDAISKLMSILAHIPAKTPDAVTHTVSRVPPTIPPQ